ncbi:hypothetical protein LTS08_008689 [Lithohypha guttulata]|nr:hypothetical protein LTS08_008689 [Lithohypha guttulata]
MSWKDQLKRFKGEWDKFNAEHNILPGNHSQQPQAQQQYYPQQQQQQQHPQYNRASAAPQYNQQPQQPINTIYWQANFDPNIPIEAEWEPKQGNNNGWGNNELEFYTGNPENCFYTNDRKLIVRAIANNNAPDPSQKYTSARLVSRQRLARDRGVLSAVLTSPCASGIWPAFWLLPFEPFAWPGDGEVDIMETWNGERKNHSCLHWGTYTGEDWNKHITQQTQLDHMPTTPIRYDFAWDQPGGQAGQGRMIWYIDGRPVMKATVPGGTRPLRDFTILLNVAMGGTVAAGQIPRDGGYDLVVHWLAMMDELENGGWGRFESDWGYAPEGKVG